VSLKYRMGLRIYDVADVEIRFIDLPKKGNIAKGDGLS